MGGAFCSVRERKATPYACKVVTMCKRCGSERLLESWAIIPRPAGLICKQLPRIDACGEQGVALQVRGLPVVVTGDAHGAHEHVRQTPLCSFPYI